MSEPIRDSLTDDRKGMLERVLTVVTSAQGQINWSILCTGPYWHKHFIILEKLAECRALIDEALGKGEV